MSSNQPQKSVWQLVKVPAIITLIVSLARLAGEYFGWSPLLFSNKVGGGFAVVGIVWLVIVFGFYFGWRLCRSDQGPDRPGMSVITFLVAIVIGAGIGFAVFKVLEIGRPQGGLYMFAGFWLVSLVTIWTWPKLFAVSLLYGLAARIPVILITCVCVWLELGTHYDKLDPDLQIESKAEGLFWLAAPQIGFWVPFTILVGGLFASFAAILAQRERGAVEE